MLTNIPSEDVKFMPTRGLVGADHAGPSHDHNPGKASVNNQTKYNTKHHRLEQKARLA